MSAHETFSILDMDEFSSCMHVGTAVAAAGTDRCSYAVRKPAGWKKARWERKGHVAVAPGLHACMLD